MKNHTELLNYIAEKIDALGYLEIGIFNPDHNFNHINVPVRFGVDPDVNHDDIIKTISDEFFKKDYGYFDLIFIDGLHHADQVKKDIINSWAHLNEGGVIVIHDTNPYSEHITHVPRDNREWSGDVYKTVCQIKRPYFFTIGFDYGCTIIPKHRDRNLEISNYSTDWDYFNKHRKQLLNLVSLEEGLKIIDSWTKIKDSEDSTNQTKEINAIL